MSKESPENKAEVHPLTVEEYAKVHSVLERIRGLRKAMVGTAVLGAAVSFFIFVSFGVHFSPSGYTVVNYTNEQLAQALLYSPLAFVPFIIVLGFLMYRVDRHIDRLARGKYEQPIIID